MLLAAIHIAFILGGNVAVIATLTCVQGSIAASIGRFARVTVKQITDTTLAARGQRTVDTGFQSAGRATTIVRIGRTIVAEFSGLKYPIAAD